MTTFQWMIGLLLGAVLLSALARRMKVPYPTFLAIGGMLLAFVPVGPVLDAGARSGAGAVRGAGAAGCRLRHLAARPPEQLAAGLDAGFIAVGLTTAAVAVLAHWLLPDMPWAAAIALGAIVAPPDAAAATAILRQVKLPYRHPQNPRRREPAQRRQRAADLSRRGRRRRGPSISNGASLRRRSRWRWPEAWWPAICSPGFGRC